MKIKLIKNAIIPILACISFVQSYPLQNIIYPSTENGIEITGLAETAMAAQNLNFNALQDLDQQLRALTTDEDGTFMTLNEYILSAVDVRHRGEKNSTYSERLSRACSIANNKDEATSFDECMSGRLYSEIESLFSVTASINHHAQRIIACYENETLTARDITGISQSEFEGRNGVENNTSATCRAYGDSQDSEYLLSSLPHDILKQGSADGVEVYKLTNRGRYNNSWTSFHNIRLAIQDDCNQIKTYNISSWERYCEPYMHFDINNSVALFPHYIRKDSSNRLKMNTTFASSVSSGRTNVVQRRYENCGSWGQGCRARFYYHASRTHAYRGRVTENCSGGGWGIPATCSTNYPISVNQNNCGLMVEDGGLNGNIIDTCDTLSDKKGAIMTNLRSNIRLIKDGGDKLRPRSARVEIAVARTDISELSLTGMPSFTGVPAHLRSPNSATASVLGAYNDLVSNNRFISCNNTSVNSEQRFTKHGVNASQSEDNFSITGQLWNVAFNNNIINGFVYLPHDSNTFGANSVNVNYEVCSI